MVKDSHNYKTRASGKKLLSYSAQDQRSIGYRLPREWQLTPSDIREACSLKAMKKRSKQSLLSQYGLFVCATRNCYLCSRNAENASGSWVLRSLWMHLKLGRWNRLPFYCCFAYHLFYIRASVSPFKFIPEWVPRALSNCCSHWTQIVRNYALRSVLWSIA